MSPLEFCACGVVSVGCWLCCSYAAACAPNSSRAFLLLGMILICCVSLLLLRIEGCRHFLQARDSRECCLRSQGKSAGSQDKDGSYRSSTGSRPIAPCNADMCIHFDELSIAVALRNCCPDVCCTQDSLSSAHVPKPERMRVLVRVQMTPPIAQRTGSRL